MDKKLNNLINFREFELKPKLENTPGKTFENVKSFEEFNEGFFTDKITGVKKFLTNTTDSDIAEAKQRIMSNPAKRSLLQRLQEKDPDAAQKYIEFISRYPDVNENPEWDAAKRQWVSRSSLSFGANTGKRF